MRLAASIFASALLVLSTLATHAETITTFTLNRGSDVIQFSLTDSSPVTYFKAFGGVDEFDYKVPLTVNGVGFSTGVYEGVESQQALGVGAELYVGYQGIFYFETGPQIFTKVNGKPVYTPGTYIFPELNYTVGNQAGPVSFPNDTLVISQADSAVSPVPEPSIFVLLGTGFVGIAGMGCRKFLRL